ncbi:MAG: RHS repeat-associated core domain-containing protein [Segetibacter sp.]
MTKVLYAVSDPDGTSGGNPTRTVNYDLDATGNRTNVLDNGTATSYSTNNMNQYTGVGSNVLTYYRNANLKTFNGWTYSYDAENRLVKADSGSTIVSFAYDPNNRCVKRIGNGAGIFFYYDVWTLIEERNYSDVEMNRYIHGDETDEILLKVSPKKYVYYHQDAIQSVVNLTDTAGNVQEKYTYDVFGTPEIKNESGSTVTNSGFNNRFLFTGREFIKELALYDYRNRIYSPYLGRFLQPDPLGFNSGDNNLYRYVGNNPIKWTDPTGTSPVAVGVGVVAVGTLLYCIYLEQTQNCPKICGAGKVKKAKHQFLGLKGKGYEGGIPCGWECECSCK